MLTKNMDDTLVNGSVGEVVGFVDPETGSSASDRPLYPKVRFKMVQDPTRH